MFRNLTCQCVEGEARGQGGVIETELGTRPVITGTTLEVEPNSPDQTIAIIQGGLVQHIVAVIVRTRYLIGIQVLHESPKIVNH